MEHNSPTENKGNINTSSVTQASDEDAEAPQEEPNGVTEIEDQHFCSGDPENEGRNKIKYPETVDAAELSELSSVFLFHTSGRGKGGDADALHHKANGVTEEGPDQPKNEEFDEDGYDCLWDLRVS